MKKLNNKGFSLVELIIVIAIMAILVGVVGSQVIPYLENSRKAKDIQVLSSWNTSAMSAYSGAAAIIDANSDYFISIAGHDKVAVTKGSTYAVPAKPTAIAATGDDCISIKNAFLELTGFNISSFTFGANGSFGSKAGQDISYCYIWVNHNGGMEMHVVMADDSKYNFDTIYSK